MIALVGASGTGKSARAPQLAAEQGIRMIIDDGLLIDSSRIVAGRSAKREHSGIAAVRRAIFNYPEDASPVSDYLRREPEQPVLVLGTSDDMVLRICQTLGLPQPSRTWRIEEIASAEEIEAALRDRRENGRHVIPAPVVEVRRSFPGYLVDPLRVLFRPYRGPQLQLERSVVRPAYNQLGQFTIAQSAVVQLVEWEAAHQPGVAEVRHVSVVQQRQGSFVSIRLAVFYGWPVHHVLTAVRQEVRTALESMMAITVLEVSVVASGLVLTPTSPHPPAGT